MLAAEQGIEPQPLVLETSVLSLYDTAMYSDEGAKSS